MWDIASVACIALAIGLRFAWRDDRAPMISALCSMLAAICGAWAFHRRRWMRDREE